MPRANDSFYLNFFLDDPLVLRRTWVLEAGVTEPGDSGVEKVLPERASGPPSMPDGDPPDLHMTACQ